MHAGTEKALGFFSDQVVTVEITDTDQKTRSPDALVTIPDDPDFPGTPLFLTDGDEWLMAVQQACPPRTPPLLGVLAM